MYNGNIAVIGGFAGDEAKSHTVHHFSKDYGWVVRFSGGNNAGHTIYTNGKKYVHNLVPCIDFSKSSANGYIGAGCAVDLEALATEVETLSKDFDLKGRIYVDKEAFVVMNIHKVIDKAQNGHIGTTNRGIGPCYTDKISRKGVRINDLLHHDLDATQNNNDELYKSLAKLQDLGVNFTHVLEKKQDFVRSPVIFEGAQSVLLDINWGTYPFVTSSDCTPAGIYASGFGFLRLDEVYGVNKVYTTRVGNGPFPTEIQDPEFEQALREKGGEFGATTGRPRRCGWLDLPAMKYAIEKGGITKLIFSKFDIFNNFEKFKVCTSYGKDIPNVVSPRNFFDAKPEYIEMEGWNDSYAHHPFDFDKNENPRIHPNILKFLRFISNETMRSVEYISCGVKPEEFFDVRNI